MPLDARPHRAGVVTAALCSLALFLPLAWPLLTRRIFVFDDLSSFHVPIRHLYAAALRGGDSLLWTPALFSGFYLHAEGQAGMFHPLHLLLYGTLPLGLAFNLEFLASYVFAFAGMYLFLRRLTLPAEAALAGAMLFAFGGFQLLHFHHMNAIAVIAHLPWLLAAIDALMTSDTPSRRAAGYAAIGITIASAVLLGFPQGLWWNLLAAAAFAIYRASERARYGRLLPCALAGVTGLALGGIQLLPTLDLAAHSTRAGIAREFALMYSLHPYNLVQLWSPYAFAGRVYSRIDTPLVHEFGVYAGTLALLAPIWLWTRRDAVGARGRFALAGTAFALLMLVLALGRYGWIDVLLTHLPGLGSLRAPARYVVLAQFALAIVSALALDDLARRPWPRPGLTRRAIVLICIPAVLSIATTLAFNTRLISIGPRAPVPASLGMAAAGSALVVGVTVAFLAAARTNRAVPLLVAVAALDLGCWGLSYVRETRPRPIAALTRMVPPAPVGWRYHWADEWRNRPVLTGHRLAWGYAGLFPATRLPADSAAFLELAGVTGVVGADGAVVPAGGASPRARFPSDTRSPVAVVSDRPGRIVVRTNAASHRRLVITERFHEGWRASLEGSGALPVVAFAGDFLACDVPPGPQQITFRFMPRSFVMGSALSAAGGVALALGALLIRRRRADAA